MEHKLIFLRDYQVQAVNGASYKKGQTVTFPDEASAQHFLSRGLAVPPEQCKDKSAQLDKEQAELLPPAVETEKADTTKAAGKK